MDMNLVVLAGRIAATPEFRKFESGARLLRLLVIVRLEAPRRRLDVIPVTRWDPTDEDLDRQVGDRIHVTGTVQRRFWSNPDGRRSRLEVIAEHITCNQDSSQAETPG
jgi:single-stranded DNA-binding protein